MSQIHRITTDPQQCDGRPCSRGLRIRVKDVLDILGIGVRSQKFSRIRAGLLNADQTVA